MKKNKTIITLGLIHNLEQMKTPITNIMLSFELIASENDEEKKALYYSTIKSNAIRLETSIMAMCNFFKDLDSDAATQKESILRNTEE